MEEVGEHNSREDCWCVFQGQVYDMTEYLASHPGGVEILLDEGGKNIDRLVQEYHSWVNVKHILRDKHMGSVQVRRQYLGIS